MSECHPRRFRIRRCECGDGWTWECSLCQPPAHGARHGAGAWQRIVDITIPGHMARLGAHHRYVARTRGTPEAFLRAPGGES